MADSENLILELLLPESAEEASQSVEYLQIIMKKLVIKLKNTLLDALSDCWSAVQRQAGKLKTLLKNAFTVRSLEDYEQAAAIYGASLAGTLYDLQVQFEGLKASVIRCAAPIVSLFVPVIQKAVQALTQFLNTIAQAMGAVFGNPDQLDRYKQGFEGIDGSVKKLSRTLAGFDQIQRLGQKSGTYSGGFFIWDQELSSQASKLAQWLQELIKPLQSIDLGPAAASLERFKKAMQPITRALFEALEWAWHNILVPLAQWTAQELLPAFLDTLTVVLEQLATVIEQIKPYLKWLWEEFLKPLAQYKAEQLLQYLQQMADKFQNVGSAAGGIAGPTQKLVESIKLIISTMGGAADQALGLSGSISKIAGDLIGLGTASAAVKTPFGAIATVIGGVKQALSEVVGSFGDVSGASGSAWEAIQNTWGGVWNFLKEKVLGPALSGVKGSINGVITYVNGLLESVILGINTIIQSLNKLSFKVPGWVPGFGDKVFGFQIPELKVPKIPLLAQGAVLPANKPFLAMVGDQKHGTNVEAPLSTIQEAVAAVMDGNTSAIVACFNALLEENRALRSTVEQIQIGDSVIGEAAGRYMRKMAVVTGG